MVSELQLSKGILMNLNVNVPITFPVIAPDWFLDP